jgi:hypothetical protein
MSNPDNHPHRLRISYGPRMVFAETVTSVTMTTTADGTLKLEATFEPPQPDVDEPTGTDIADVMPGWGDDNPGLCTNTEL